MTLETYIQAAKEILSTKGLTGFGKYVTAEMFRIGVRQAMFSSYSQNWEDLQVQKLLGGIEKGFYIDIGCSDPIRLNNTYHFYRLGWRGILMEPNPQMTSWFKNLRPHDVFLPSGVGKKSGEMKFFNFEIPSISTFSEIEANKRQAKGYKLKEAVQIKVITPTEIYKLIPKGKRIDFLSVDTEGWDYDILQSWDFKKYAPKVICVERESTDTRIDLLLQEKGYFKVYSNSINNIYLRD